MNADAWLEHPWHIHLQQRDDGDGAYWFATVEELPGCMSDGDTEAEALASVRDAMHGWISAALEAGRPVPEPRDDTSATHPSPATTGQSERSAILRPMDKTLGKPSERHSAVTPKPLAHRRRQGGAGGESA